MPIYNPINSSSSISNSTTLNSPPTTKEYHTPQLQDLLFAPSDDLLNIECSSAFPSQVAVSDGNPLVPGNCDIHWPEQLITTPANINNAPPVFKVPNAPGGNQKYTSNNPGPRRMSSWPHIEYESRIEEPFVCNGNGQVYYNASNNSVDRLMDNCSLISPQKTSSLSREKDSCKTDKRSHHRRTSSDTNLMQFVNVMDGTNTTHLLPNETFNMPFPEQTQQHLQQLTQSTNRRVSSCIERKRSQKRKKKPIDTHPYPHCFHNTKHTVSNHKLTIIQVSLCFPCRPKQVL